MNLVENIVLGCSLFAAVWLTIRALRPGGEFTRDRPTVADRVNTYVEASRRV